MSLHPEEQKLSEFGSLTLTTHRICQGSGYTAKRHRMREMASIRLEHITHCQITSGDQPSFIVMGLLLIIVGTIGGGYTRTSFFIFLGLILGIALIIGYFTDRYSEIEIASPTLPLRYRMRKKSLEEAKSFVEWVQLAAIERSDSRREPAQARGMANADYWGG
jgi:hypothetical protein